MLLSLVVAVVALALAPLYDGVERKVRAAIHTRIGPPILQTWYDIVKLLSKEVVIPVGGLWSVLVVVLELATLAAASILLIFISTTGFAESVYLETVSFIVLVGVTSALAIVRAISQNNVFSVVGGFREFMLILSTEPFMVASLLLLASGVGTLTTRGLTVLTLTVSAYVFSGRIPYDIAEAEPELASGVNIELAGPVLGIATTSAVLKKMVSATLTSLAIVSLAGLRGIESLVAVTLMTPAVWIVHTIVSILLGRSRVDLSTKFLYVTLIFLCLILLVSFGLGL